MASDILHDDMGHYVLWQGVSGDGSYWSIRSLSTRDRKKAKRWLIQGNCHGVDHHEVACDQCVGEENQE